MVKIKNDLWRQRMIRIKDSSVMFSLLCVAFDEKLIDVLTWIENEYPGRIVLTCGYRAGDKGVHGANPCRGADIRSWVFKHPDKVCNYINMVWEYDSERPDMKVAIFHDSGSGNHIHLQSHPNTRRKT